MTRQRSMAVSMVLMAGVAVWAASAFPRSERASAPASGGEHDPRAATAEAGLPPLPRDDWQLGEQRVYRVDQSTSIASKHAQGEAQVSLIGAFELTLTPFEKDERGTTVRVELHAREVKRIQNGQTVSMTDEIGAQLAKPLAIVVDDSGAISRLIADPAMDLAAHGFVRGILSGLQLIAPQPATLATWSTQELDSSGKYVARYVRRGPLVVSKIKSRFEDASDPALGMQERRRNARTELVLTEGTGIPARVDGTQDEVTRLKQGELHTRGHVQLVLERVVQVSPTPMAVDRRRGGSLLDAPHSVTLTRAQYADMARGHSVQSLMREVQTSDRADDQVRANLMGRLEAVLRTEGGHAIAEAAQAVRELSSDDDARLFMGALDAAQAPEAQAALLGLAKDGALIGDRRTTAVMHLGLSESPTVETLEGLRGMSEDAELDGDLRDTASLALGGALRRADGEAQSSTTASVDYLIERVAAAKTPQARAVALEALGNSGSADALPTLREALDDPSSWLRASAANGLRHIESEDADALLCKAASGDPDPAVRRQALSTLLYRALTDDTRKLLVDALSRDTDVAVRLTAVDVMSSHLEREATFAQALEQSSEQDQDPRVRERALAVLNSDSLVR